MGEHLTHGRTVRHLAVGIRADAVAVAAAAALGTFVRVNEQYELLLDEFTLFGVVGAVCAAHRCGA